MLIFVLTNNVWGIYLFDPSWLLFVLAFFVYVGLSSILVTIHSGGGASEPGGREEWAEEEPDEDHFHRDDDHSDSRLFVSRDDELCMI